MTLEAKRYAISKSYDGTDFEDACQILRILFQLKEYCMERTQAPAEWNPLLQTKWTAF